MRETAAELAALQALIDTSHANAKPHMRGIESSAFDWSGHGVHVRLDADRFYTYSRTPEAFPS